MSRRDDNSTTDPQLLRGESTASARGRVVSRTPEGRSAPVGLNAPSVTRSVPRSRRRRRPGRILGLWARIGLLSGAVFVLLLIAVAIVAKAIRPYAEASDLKAQLAVLNQQIARTDDENAAYKRRLAYLQTPEGEKTEARSLGYLVPGEVPVVVDGTPGALSETPLPTEHPSAPTLMSRLRSFWHSLTGNR